MTLYTTYARRKYEVKQKTKIGICFIFATKIPQIEMLLICRGILIYNKGVSHTFTCVPSKLLITHRIFFLFPTPSGLA